MEFRVLGPLEVVDDGRPVKLGSGRQTLLLSRLLINANEVVSRDLLIEALEAGKQTATAGTALNVQIHALRKRLGQERIETDGPGYRFNVEPDELDLERFERLVARGRSELSAGEAEAAASTLRQALELWRGPALSDVAYEAFAQGEIARLEELRLVALEERIEAELALARHHDLVPELEALVAEHPLRERPHGQLMLALYRSGRQSDALDLFRRFRAALDEELGLEPGAELKELQQAILRQDAVLRVEPPELRARRHLPAAQTPLVGRRDELDELGALLRGGTRLVTLTGPGGTGKTRLALQAAHELADAFADGVYFVGLAPLRDPALVPSAIADALGVEEQADKPLQETLALYLRGRQVLLLVDNFERVEEAAPLLSELLTAAPGLALIVTSRTPLRLSGEHEYRVQPLSLADAAQLFARRARAVAPGFRQLSEEAEEVSEICRRLDCLPLAIELAAARTREYAPNEMLELLPGSLELAEGGARDLPARQRTLRGAIDWSYELLSPTAERDLFARLAVFVGGCTPKTAQAVCDARRSGLASLVAESLLSERPGSDGGPRFHMLETVREYALEKLEESGEADDVRRRHATHFAELAEAADDEEEAAWPLLEEEHDNLRAAVDWSHESGASELELRLVAALAIFWAVRDHLREGRTRVEAALAQEGDGPASVRANALGGASWLALRLGDYEHSERRAAESLELYRSLGDEPAMALQLNRLGAAVSNQGDLERAIAFQQQSADLYRKLGDDRGLGVVLSNLGYRFIIRGDPERARILCEEAVELLRGIDNRGSMPLPLINLGLAAVMQDSHGEALGLFRQALELARELGYPVIQVYCLEGLAAALAGTGESERAATILGAAEAGAESTGVSLEPFERQMHEQTAERLQAALGEEAFAAAQASGRQLSIDEAAAWALGERAMPSNLQA